MKAFPINFVWDGKNTGYNGMDLRDYFAAKAMQALVTGQSFDDGQWNLDTKTAYEIADAMMEARK